MQIRREMLAQARNSIIIPPTAAFDGNVITPGTPFMARLADQLRRFIEYKIASNPGWQRMQVITATYLGSQIWCAYLDLAVAGFKSSHPHDELTLLCIINMLTVVKLPYLLQISQCMRDNDAIHFFCMA